MGDVPGLFEEREKINASIREKIQERNAERDEFRKQERAFNDYLGKVLQDVDLDCAVAYDLRPCTMDLS